MTGKQQLFLFLFMSLVVNGTGQEERRVYVFSGDTSSLFIDNSKGHWYTLELKTDTFFQVEGNVYYYDDRIVQINSLFLNFRNGLDAKGRPDAEMSALKYKMKWEANYQKKEFGRNKIFGKEFFFGETGKPFFIWCLEAAREERGPIRSISFGLENKSDEPDSGGIEYTVTGDISLEFLINGNASISVCYPVYEGESMEMEKDRAKSIAATLRSFGGPIDLKILYDRWCHEGEYVYLDSTGHIRIVVPQWMNVLDSPYPNSLLLSYPEKNNIVNATSVIWEMKSDTGSFEKFIDRFERDKSISNKRILQKEPKFLRVFYIARNYFWCEDVFVEESGVFYFVKFTSTKETYEFNLARFNEFLNRISIK